MMALLRWLVSRLAVVPWLLRWLGGLGILVPIVLLLKAIGLPALMVLAIVALPVLFVLFILGLPIILVLLVGGGLLAFVFALVSVGLVALKFFIFIVLPILLIVKLGKWMFGGRGGAPPATTTERPADDTL